MDILPNLFPLNDSARRVNVDPATEALVDDLYKRGMSKDSPYMDTQKQAGLLSQEFAPKAEGLTGQPGMGQAIANKYGSIGQGEIEDLKRLQNLGSKTESFKRTGLAMNALKIKQQAEIAASERVLQYQKEEAATRQAAVNAIFGTGLTVLGTIAGGGFRSQANNSMSEPSTDNPRNNISRGNSAGQSYNDTGRVS